ncbi:MAG: tetratricopeptide repeat protein, partial [Bacteroidales bacterium]|nr:tetratricopeptide repeat protein [Bacteroidales bacterium]
WNRNEMTMMKKILFVMLMSFLGSTLFGQNVSMTIMKAKALAENRQFDEAISTISQAIASEDDPALFLERGELYLLTNDVQKAISDFNKANNLSSGSGEYGLARSYSKLGDAKNAITHLEKNQTSPYKKEEKVVLLDDLFNNISKSSEWNQYIRKDWYSSLETSLSEIEYYISTKKTSEAQAIVKELEDVYGDKNEVKYMSALCDYSAGRYSSSISKLSTLLTEEPNNMDYILLDAKAKYNSGNYAGAASSFQSLLDHGSTDATLFMDLARCEKNTREYAKASKNIVMFLSLYPQNEEALQLAGEMKVAQGEYLGALDYLSRNLESNPNDADNYVKRGDVYLMAKSWSLATRDYGMALDLNPSNGDTWYNKGMAHVNLQETEDACYCFKMAQKRGNSKAESQLAKYCK